MAYIMGKPIPVAQGPARGQTPDPNLTPKLPRAIISLDGQEEWVYCSPDHQGEIPAETSARTVEIRTMSKKTPDMIQGTLDMLILKVLQAEPMHGWGITKRIQQVSEGALQVNQGSLYTSLLRMTRAGWIKSHWQVTENNRKAKYYGLTRAGESQLEVEEERWERLTVAVDQILGLA